jgi:hypothetical protein
LSSKAEKQFPGRHQNGNKLFLQNSTFDPKISLLDSQGSRGELCSRGELVLSCSSRGELKLPQFPCFASFIQNLPYYDAAIQSFLIQKFYKTNKYVK